MSGIRKVEAGVAISWFTRAVDVGGRNARAVFGAGLLGIVMIMAVALVAGLAMGLAMAAGTPAGQAPDMAAAMPWVLGLVLLMSALWPVVAGGMQQVLHGAEAGAPVSATDAFAGLRRFWPLAGLAILPVAAFAITFVNYRVFGGPDYFREYLAMMETAMAGGTPVPPQAASPAGLFLAGVLLAIVQNTLQAITVPLVQLSGRGTLGAIMDGLRMMARNPGAIAVALLVGLAAMIAVGLVAVVGGLLLAVVAGLLPILGIPLLLVGALAFVVVFFVVYSGVCYFAWRDQFAPADAAAPPEPPAAIAA